jgi:CheY-like chemotaxis protein
MADAHSRRKRREATLGETRGPENRRLILLVDHDVESRRHARHLLELHGLEVVQVSNGIAALELVQRLPESFRLVITELDLPDISGTMVAETLRIFRPDLPTLCMSSRAVAGAVNGRRCLTKPLQGPDLQSAMQNGRHFQFSDGSFGISAASIARARARYAAVGDLVEAALELARATGADEV